MKAQLIIDIHGLIDVKLTWETKAEKLILKRLSEVKRFDVRAINKSSYSDGFLGTSIEEVLMKDDDCPACKGTGILSHQRTTTQCPLCEGSGKYYMPKRHQTGFSPTGNTP